MNFFAKNIEFLREQRKLTKAAMLDQLDIPRTTWASYESNDAEPSIDRILAIAAFFGVTATELLTTDLSAAKRPAKKKGANNYAIQESIPNTVKESAAAFDAACTHCKDKDSIIEAQKVTIQALQAALFQAEERLKERAISNARATKKKNSPF